MSATKLILCMKWGTAYGPEYVNRLYGMVSRNISGAFKVVCFTDNSDGVRPEVLCLPLPELGVEVPPGAPGKWPKQALWARDLFGLEGIALFIDLDSVIVDSIDPYFEYGDPDDVIVARNWVRVFRKTAQTSVFRFRIGAHGYLLDDLRVDPQLMVKYQFEQNYVSARVRGGVRFWPEAWTKYFSRHCMGPWPLRYVRKPKLPKGARIITFPGSPNPPAAVVGKWREAHEARTRGRHLKYCLRGGPGGGSRAKLSRFVLPSDWVAEHWRE